MTESAIKCGRMDKPAKWESPRPIDWKSRVTACPDSDTKRIGLCKAQVSNKTGK